MFATISYGLCKVLKMAVYKDAVEDCPYGKATKKGGREKDEN